MKISVYITCYNKAKYIGEAIESVLHQTLQPAEIIIVDDCSTDGSREIIKGFVSRYPEMIKHIFNENNYGIAKTRNIAISHCKGELITSVDGDDYFFPSKLKSELNVINNFSYNCVYSNHVFVDEFGDEISYFAKKKEHPAEGDLFIENFTRSFNVSSHSNFHNEMFYKTNAVDIGLYDENIRIWEDWDFRIRMSKKNRYGYCSKVNSAYRISPTSLHNSGVGLHFREQIKIYKKNKFLIQDLKKKEKSYLKNRVFAKIKGLFLQIMEKNKKDKYFFHSIYISLHFIFAFKTRKSLLVALRALKGKY